jgi:AdoMet-dependent rRNA methyltransferase SPB1
LATEFLCKGGWFVTKVFRSKDYQSLIWVFGQFFKKVHATKPAASRNESAEIFVVCQYYLAPDKIDPKFLDAKHVFSDVEVEDKKTGRELVNPERKKKPGSQGYGDGVTVLYKEATATDFILGNNHIQILNDCNAIRLDDERFVSHARTTTEIKECIKDLKVLGMKELRLLKKWRDALRKEFEVVEKEGTEADSASLSAAAEKSPDDVESAELAEVEQQIANLKDEERRAARRKKKRELKEKQKRAVRLNLKMIIPGDEGPTASEEGLFRLLIAFLCFLPKGLHGLHSLVPGPLLFVGLGMFFMY